MAINFLTINSEGLNHPAKRRSLWKKALQHRCDIMCVQETPFCVSSPPKCSHPKFPFIFNANADTKQKGVMIAIRDTVAFKTHKTICDPQGRFIILICDINSTTYTIVNIYAPNTRQIRFFHKVIRNICKVQKGLLVMCGDFNVTPNPMIDSTAKPKHSPPSLKAALRSYEHCLEMHKC